MATITLSIPEVEFATRAWFAVRVPGVRNPPIARDPEVPSGAPTYKTLEFWVKASSPLASPVTTALATERLI